MDCLFCKIANGDIPSNKVYEDEKILCFHDIEPKAPVHVLIIPKKHIKNAAEIAPDDAQILAHIWTKIPEIAQSLALKEFRVITNSGKSAMQTVFHLHFHLVGGRNLSSSLG